MENPSYEKVIDKLVDSVAWGDEFDSGHENSPENDQLISFVQSLFPNRAHEVEADLHAAVEARRAEPDPDAEYNEHLERERIKELMQPVP